MMLNQSFINKHLSYYFCPLLSLYFTFDHLILAKIFDNLENISGSDSYCKQRPIWIFMVDCRFETENNWMCFLALNANSLNVKISLSIETYLSAALHFLNVFATLKLSSFYILISHKNVGINYLVINAKGQKAETPQRIFNVS